MSTTTTPKTALTTEQLAANKKAIESFLRKASISAGKGAVILMPEFVENPTTKEWEPVMNGMGARPTKNNAAFLRLGKATAKVTSSGSGNSVQWSFLYTNLFGTDSDSLGDLIAFTDPNAVVGGAIKNVRVVVHESLKPFSKTNPDRDLKQTPDGIKLTYSGVTITDDGEVITHSNEPIYRKVQVFFADDEGNYPENAKNILINHTNTEETSNAARARWNTANTNSIKTQAQAAMNAK